MGPWGPPPPSTTMHPAIDPSCIMQAECEFRAIASPTTAGSLQLNSSCSPPCPLWSSIKSLVAMQNQTYQIRTSPVQNSAAAIHAGACEISHLGQLCGLVALGLNRPCIFEEHLERHVHAAKDEYALVLPGHSRMPAPCCWLAASDLRQERAGPFTGGLNHHQLIGQDAGHPTWTRLQDRDSVHRR